MALSYITYSDIASYTEKTFTAGEQTMLTNVIIPGIQSSIEAYTNRKFGVQGDANSTMYYPGSRHERYDYDPMGSDVNALKRNLEIAIDDFVTIVSVTEVDWQGNEFEYDLADIELLPLNASYKNRMYMKNGSFTGYKYKVVGRVGSSDLVPSEVKLAALQIASDLLDSISTIKREQIEGYDVIFDTSAIMYKNPSVLMALDKWKKILI